MKPERNAPCPCGSGKKFKKCCQGNPTPSPSRLSAPSDSEINELVALFQSRQLPILEERTRQLLTTYPDSGFLWKALGIALQAQGKNGIPALEKAANYLPQDAETRNNLGNALLESGQPELATAYYRQALVIQPDFAVAHFNLGNALRCLGQFSDAAASYRHATGIHPNYADAHSNLGAVLARLGRWEDAVASYERALAIKPALVETRSNLGNALKELGQLAAAERHCHNALAIAPAFAPAHNNLGTILEKSGRTDEAIACYERALTLQESFSGAHSNLLFVLNYSAGHTPAERLAQARLYGQRLAQSVPCTYSAWNCAVSPQRLKLGLVSGDFFNHPVSFFLESVLHHLDRERLELIAYPTHPKEDELTQRLRPLFSAWTPLSDMTDDAAAARIHADGVHILLDLSGHTRGNRLPLFARKPAPLQISWLGYFATTGLTEMDYVLVDSVGLPAGAETQFVETPCFLPDSRLCFTPPRDVPPVSPLPALSTGHLTFASFQNLNKLGDDVLSLWRDLLTALPQARLRLQCVHCAEQEAVLHKRLLFHGFPLERVSLHRAVSRSEYFRAYSEVDLILDTFPYPGGTTTCEALWMGVPTLTLAGKTLLERQGASLLSAAGLPDWITEDRASYLEKAIAASTKLPALAALRARLRDQVNVSALVDAQRFVAHFEAALWKSWRHCGAPRVEKSLATFPSCTHTQTQYLST